MKSINIVIALLFLNAGATALVASGVAADWGIQPNIGGDSQIDEANEQAENLAPAGGGGGTLFTLFTQAASTLRTVLALMIVGGPLMLVNLGVPGWLVTLVFAPAVVIVFADIYYAITGRQVNS